MFLNASCNGDNRTKLVPSLLTLAAFLFIALSLVLQVGFRKGFTTKTINDLEFFKQRINVELKTEIK